MSHFTMLSRAITFILLIISAAAVWGGEAAPAAEDPALERRVMTLSAELRCLVCQNQSLADSNAPLAVDLRNQVRDKMRAGMSDQQIVDFMVVRYGDFVLFRPPFKLSTALLWLGPLLLLVAGIAALVYRLTRRREEPARELTESERERARALLSGRGGEGS
jgi:cytochrome c-type biogenesis protein CcmH